MKKSILISIIAILLLSTSCGKNKEEKMLYNYVQRPITELFHTDISELDFKINHIEKIGVVTASDSMKILKDELAIKTFGKDFTQENLDTLTYNYTINLLESLISSIEETISYNNRNGQEYENYEEENKKKAYEKELVKTKNNKIKYEIYSKNPKTILVTKYQASYSMTNPVLKIKQTFNKVFYTNEKGDRFVTDEEIK